VLQCVLQCVAVCCDCDVAVVEGACLATQAADEVAGRRVCVCCSVLHWVALCCSVLQFIASVLQCLAVCCSVGAVTDLLVCGSGGSRARTHTRRRACGTTPCVYGFLFSFLYVAVCCSMLQCVSFMCVAVRCRACLLCVLQCVAVCCSVLQCVAVCCSAAVVCCSAAVVCCSVLQCCCSVLQCVVVLL